MYFSVVIPLYNKEKSISKTLESVLRQTHKDFEILVVNDGSTDKSAEVVAELAKQDSRIRLLNKPNGGVCSARNMGIENAQYDYIAFLDGDDIWDEKYLTEQVRMITDFPKATMWGINFAEIENGTLARKLVTGLPDGFRGYVENYFQMKGRVSDLFCSSSVVVYKAIFNKAGLFDERIKYAEDNDMWFRIIAISNVAFYDKFMVFYQFDAENRALKRKIELKYFLPYYVDKYQQPYYIRNKVFYQWINRWSAQQIRKYYFSNDKEDQQDANLAIKKLDYSQLTKKYTLLYKTPKWLGKLFNMIYNIK